MGCTGTTRGAVPATGVDTDADDDNRCTREAGARDKRREKHRRIHRGGLPTAATRAVPTAARAVARARRQARKARRRLKAAPQIHIVRDAGPSRCNIRLRPDKLC